MSVAENAGSPEKRLDVKRILVEGNSKGLTENI